MGGVDLKSAYQFDRRSRFRFCLRLFFFFELFDVALVNSFIVSKKLENKDLTLEEFKICIATMQTICHSNAPKLKKPAQYLHHICPFSWRQYENVLYAPKQEKRTEHLLLVHYVM